MLLRLLIGLLASILIAQLAWWQETHAGDAERLAHAMRGERWFRLSLDDRLLGYLHTATFRDLEGRWTFTSDLRFALNPGSPVAVSENLVFAPRSPNMLVAAAHRTMRGAVGQEVVLSYTGTDYTAAVAVLPTGSVPASPPQSVSLDFDLNDYLAFETWLDREHPQPGARVAMPNLDFDRLAIDNRQFRVVDLNHTGYLVGHPEYYDDTTIQLNDSFVPVRMTMSGLFDLEASSRAEALAPRSELYATSYQVAIDQRLRDHTNIKRLELAIDSSLPIEKFWSTISGGTLNVYAEPLSPAASNNSSHGPDDLAATTTFPANHPDIVALAETVAGNSASQSDFIRKLTQFVHGYLRYRPDVASRPVLALLEDPEGDCTEFSDLFTTLARSRGIPARTVFGLAYSDRKPPVFAFHSWNEVFVADRWDVVDPTWNQTRVDATHIPLPADDPVALKVMTGTAELRFHLRDLEYFSTTRGTTIPTTNSATNSATDPATSRSAR